MSFDNVNTSPSRAEKCRYLAEAGLLTVYDFDYTLFFTREYLLNSHRRLHKFFELPCAEEHISKFHYKHKEEYFGPKWGKDLAEQIAFIDGTYMAKMVEMVQGEEETYEEVEPCVEMFSFIEDLKGYGIPSTIFSSGNEKYIKNILKKFGKDYLFDYIYATDIGLDKDKHEKPHTDGLVKTVEYMSSVMGRNILPQNVVMFGDSLPYDVEAGKAFGAITVLVLFVEKAREQYYMTIEKDSSLTKPDFIIETAEDCKGLVDFLYDKLKNREKDLVNKEK